MASLKRFATLGGAAAVNTDPQFNLTTLLLHGDGTNGAQNNTFIDSSSNNFTITRAGNATQGTFTPFSQTGWSNNFGGTSGLQTPASSITNIIGTSGLTTSSIFTAEAWIYLTQYSTNEAPIFGDMTPAAGTKYFALGVNATGKLEFSWYLAPNTYKATGNTTIPINTWTNVAVTISGTTIYLFVNGVLQTLTGTTTNSGSSGGTGFIGIGEWNGGASNLGLFGYISNLRIIKSAFYTSSYTPSIVPLTAVTGTGLLTCQSNRFIDKSSNGYTLTASGTPSVQAFSPFAPISAYSTSVVGGSGYFDGTGDWLTRAFTSTTDGMYPQGTTYTIEAWVYMTNTSGTQPIYVCAATNTTNFGLFEFFIVSGVLRFNIRPTTGGTVVSVSGGNVKANEWTHITGSVSAGTARLFVNGVLVGTPATFSSLSFTPTGAGIGYTQNGFISGITSLTGYMGGLRLTQGGALYTANFTPPTSPFTTTVSSGTVSFLLNYTNAGIIDNTSKNDLETVGNAQISTAVKKFGTGSLAFDGTGDWLTFPNSAITQIGSGNFTIEGWVYVNAIGVAYGLISKGTATTGWSVNITSGNKLQFSYTATALTGATSLAANTWYYFAVVRSGTATGNLKIYLNGSVDATSAGAVTDNFNQTNIGYIGASRTATTALNGYLDDLRITLAARTITTPTAAFADQ